MSSSRPRTAACSADGAKRGERAAHCAALAPRHAPAAERAAVRGLLADLLAYRAA